MSAWRRGEPEHSEDFFSLLHVRMEERRAGAFRGLLLPLLHVRLEERVGVRRSAD